MDRARDPRNLANMNGDDVPTSPWRKHGTAVVAALKKLQFKSSVALSLLMVSIIVFSSSAYKRMSSAVILETQAGRCRDVASTLAVAALEPLSLRDSSSLEALGRAVIAEADLLYVIFTDVAGEVLGQVSKGAHAFPPLADVDKSLLSGRKLARPLYHPADRDTPAFLAFTYPIIASHNSGPGTVPQKELVGYVHLALGISSVKDALVLVDRSLVAITLILLGLVVPISLFLVYWIVNPINKLAAVVRRYGAGDMSARVPFKRNDEIGQLGNAFNNLADELERSHNQLIKLNAELEDRVVQRTEQLKELASRDALTGLHNRRHFAESLNRTFAEAMRYGTDLACLMIDLDELKEVNDTYGHKMGDELLVAAGGAISSQLRASDLAARYGGDEFVVLLPRTSLMEARNIAERILRHFEQTIDKSFLKLGVGLSIGVSSFATIAFQKPDALLARADRALYEAKEMGKNRIALADPVPVI